MMKTKKKGNNWTAYYDPDTNRYFAEIMYTSREGREEYDYEITKEIYDRLIAGYGQPDWWPGTPYAIMVTAILVQNTAFPES